MADFLNDKEYGDYFRRIEAELSAPPVNNYVSEPRPENTKVKRRVRLNMRPVLAAVALIVVFAVIVGIVKISSNKDKYTVQKPLGAGVKVNKDKSSAKIVLPKADKNTVDLSGQLNSKYAVVINRENKKILASVGADVRSSPASTTKIMTMLVAVEKITDFNDTFVITTEITDKVFIEKATAAGFAKGEAPTMYDLLYGCILPSGADAALGLAYKLCGSEEAFVEEMNRKVKELGLKNTHFTNVTGLYDADHYSTVSDMAVILDAAMKNEMCREILSTFQFRTSYTSDHPQGILLTSTLFEYIYGNEPETAEILGGKTGYVNESGYCIASFGKSQTGTEYICVTFGAQSIHPSTKDQIQLYKEYAK